MVGLTREAIFGDNTVWNNACKAGDIDTVMYLHYNDINGCSTNAMDYAAEHGHLDLVIWLHENRHLDVCAPRFPRNKWTAMIYYVQCTLSTVGRFSIAATQAVTAVLLESTLCLLSMPTVNIRVVVPIL